MKESEFLELANEIAEEFGLFIAEEDPYYNHQWIVARRIDKNTRTIVGHLKDISSRSEESIVETLNNKFSNLAERGLR